MDICDNTKCTYYNATFFPSINKCELFADIAGCEYYKPLVSSKPESTIKTAIKLSKIVHDECHSAPHDIGLKLAQDVYNDPEIVPLSVVKEVLEYYAVHTDYFINGSWEGVLKEIKQKAGL